MLFSQDFCHRAMNLCRPDRRSLHCATPDFLSSLVALANFMRPSLRKAAYLAIINAA
jgi:hypothetical protein